MKKICLILVIGLSCLFAACKGQEDYLKQEVITAEETPEKKPEEGTVEEKTIEEKTEDRMDIQQVVDSKADNESEMTDEELRDAYYERYYRVWAEGEMEEAIGERSTYYRQSSYHEEVINYMENIREERDISNIAEPLFYTDMKYYSKEDFEEVPSSIITLAKNEIYARHGYIFKNQDLNDYFMGCIWYNPSCSAEEFDDSVFNSYEKANVIVLAELDKK